MSEDLQPAAILPFHTAKAGTRVALREKAEQGEGERPGGIGFQFLVRDHADQFVFLAFGFLGFVSALGLGFLEFFGEFGQLLFLMVSTFEVVFCLGMGDLLGWIAPAARPAARSPMIIRVRIEAVREAGFGIDRRGAFHRVLQEKHKRRRNNVTDVKRKVCVYTSLIGDYENLNEQSVAGQTNIPFYCFTDNPNLKSDTWNVVTIDPALRMDPIRSQRLLKFRPWEILPDYDASLYIDNSVRLLVPPEELFAQHSAEQGLTLPAHSFRQSVLDEFLEVARLGLDDQFRIFEQLNHYQLECPNILQERPYWAGLLIREHASPAVRRMADIWR
jgi:hypothetical protein